MSVSDLNPAEGDLELIATFMLLLLPLGVFIKRGVAVACCICILSLLLTEPFRDSGCPLGKSYACLSQPLIICMRAALAKGTDGLAEFECFVLKAPFCLKGCCTWV